MPLKPGIIMMVCALAFAGAVAAYVVLDEPMEGRRREARRRAFVRAAEAFLSPEEHEVKAVSSRARRPRPKPEPELGALTSHSPNPSRRPSPAEPEPEPVPATRDRSARADGGPDRGGRRAAALQAAAGAIMGLTMKSLEVYNAPVFDSDERVGADQRHRPPAGDLAALDERAAAQRVPLGAPARLARHGSHLVFYRLNDLRNGDEILLRSRDGTGYRYRVREMFTASPTDAWVTGQVRNRDMVTLQTCVGPNWQRRLIIRADRV